MLVVNCLDYLQQDSSKEEMTEEVKELPSSSAEGSDSYEEIVFNPNVFTDFKLAGNPEVVFEFICTLSLPIYTYSLWFDICLPIDFFP